MKDKIYKFNCSNEEMQLFKAKSLEYTKKVNSTVIYAEPSKFEDNIKGKLCEYLIKHYCDQQGIICSEPDIEVYSSKDKSWASDLNIDGKDTAVKYIFTECFSITFQDEQPGRRDPVLDKPSAKIIAVLIIGQKIILVETSIDNLLMGKTIDPNPERRDHKKIGYFTTDTIYNIHKLLHPEYSEEDIKTLCKLYEKKIAPLLF